MLHLIIHACGVKAKAGRMVVVNFAIFVWSETLGNPKSASTTSEFKPKKFCAT